MRLLSIIAISLVLSGCSSGEDADQGGMLTVSINQRIGQPDPTSDAEVAFAVHFNRPVTGFTGAGISFAGSTVGGTPVASVSGRGASYTVTVVGMRTSGEVVASVRPAAATAADGTWNAPSTSSDNSVTFVNPSPSVTIEQAPGQADPTDRQPLRFQVRFSEPVVGFDPADVRFEGSAGGIPAAEVTGREADYTVEVAGLTSSGDLRVTIPEGAAYDPQGAPSLASTSRDNQVTYRDEPPAVTINQAPDQADPTDASPVTFVIDFSKPVIGLDRAAIDLAGSAGEGWLYTNFTPVTSTRYLVSVAGMRTNGQVVARVPAGAVTDWNGRPNAASTSIDNRVTFSNPAPTVTINQAPGQTDPTSTRPIRFVVQFSEPVRGFGGSRVTFAGSTAPGTLIGDVTGSGASYILSVSGMTGPGVVRASVPAGAATDNGGAGNVASTSLDNAVQFQ